ncbi:MAG: DCC1-like thiol-disulfide oxidoreductase family protein [Cyclobacteriaceae bacterium]
MGSDSEVEHAVVFFDGVCNLCNASVRFIIKRDSKDYFRFASLQGDYARDTLPEDLTRNGTLPSLVLLDKELHTKSSAALGIARHLSGVWPIFSVFTITPAFIRDFIYDLIAKNRYWLFGKKDVCMLPAPELQHLFID